MMQTHEGYQREMMKRVQLTEASLPEVLDVAGAATLLRVKKHVVYRLAEKDRTFPARKAGKRWVFSKADVLAWIGGKDAEPAPAQEQPTLPGMEPPRLPDSEFAAAAAAQAQAFIRSNQGTSILGAGDLFLHAVPQEDLQGVLRDVQELENLASLAEHNAEACAIQSRQNEGKVNSLLKEVWMLADSTQKASNAACDASLRAEDYLAQVREKLAKVQAVVESGTAKNVGIQAPPAPTEQMDRLEKFLEKNPRPAKSPALVNATTSELLAELLHRGDGDVWMDMDGTIRKGHQ